MSKPALRQFGILDLLLLMALAAVWTAAGVNSGRIVELEKQIAATRSASLALFVQDPSVYNAIEQIVVRYPDQAWEVYLPAGRKYRLHFVTRGIADDGFPTGEAHQSAELKPGQHRIELVHEQDEQGDPRFVLTAGEAPDAVKIVAQESADWNPSGGSSSQGVGKSHQTAPLDQPFVLKRQRAHVKLPSGGSSSPPGTEPANGLLIWIEAD